MAPVAEALRMLQQQTFPAHADNLQSACAKAPAEARGLFGLLATLAGANDRSSPEATLATPTLDLWAEPACLPSPRSSPAQKETQTELATNNEAATQTEPEDTQTEDEKKPETLQGETADYDDHFENKSTKKKKKKKKPAKELDAQTPVDTAVPSARTTGTQTEKEKKRVKFKQVSVTHCSDADEDAEYYGAKAPDTFSDYDSADEDPMALRFRYGVHWRPIVSERLQSRGLLSDLYIDIWGNPSTHAHVTAHRKERWLNRADRLGEVVQPHFVRLLA